MRPHRRQPTRLPHPWDSPGKNTGVGCHFLLQCMKVKSLSHVWLLATPWTAAHQAPPSTGFSGQEDWGGVPLPPLSGLLGKGKPMLSVTLSAVNYMKNVIFLTFLSCLLFYNLVFYLGFLKMLTFKTTVNLAWTFSSGRLTLHDTRKGVGENRPHYGITYSTFIQHLVSI